MRATLTALALIAATTAQAQQNCAPLSQIETRLALGYGEFPTARGVSADQSLVLVYAHPNGDTWSVLVLRPDGLACLVASGDGWEQHAPQDPGQAG